MDFQFKNPESLNKSPENDLITISKRTEKLREKQIYGISNADTGDITNRKLAHLIY